MAVIEQEQLLCYPIIRDSCSKEFAVAAGHKLLVALQITYKRALRIVIQLSCKDERIHLVASIQKCIALRIKNLQKEREWHGNPYRALAVKTAYLIVVELKVAYKDLQRRTALLHKLSQVGNILSLSKSAEVV